MPITSFAAGDNLTITVKGEVAGRTLSLYKLFDMHVDGDNYYYTWDNLPSEEFFTGKGYDTIFKATEYLKSLENNSTELTNLAEDYYTYCINKSIPAISKKDVSNDAKSVEFNGLDKGYYLIYDETTASEKTARSAAIVSNLKENREVLIKVDTIDVEKEANINSASYGDIVNFTVKSKVPEMIGYSTYEFEIIDTLSKGLTLVENDNGVVNVKITIDGKDYTEFVTEKIDNADETTTLKIKFNNFIRQKINSGKEIKIEYQATINKKAAIEKDNTNNVKIIYSNDPNKNTKGETNTDVVHIYTYEIDFTKKNSFGNPLAGAEFVLQLENGKYAKLDNAGIFEEAVDSIENATKLLTGEDGIIKILGLKEGTYKLIETKAPTDYNTPDFSFDFRIIQELNEDGTLKNAKFDYIADKELKEAKGYIKDTKNSDNSAIFKVDVLNSKKGLLPSTGGMGTIIFTIAGIAIMATAGTVIALKNKRENA